MPRHAVGNISESRSEGRVSLPALAKDGQERISGDGQLAPPPAYAVNGDAGKGDEWNPLYRHPAKHIITPELVLVAAL